MITKTVNNSKVYKGISNRWGLVISDLINNGNHFFSITINPILNCFDFKSHEERSGFEYDLISHIVKDFPTISFIWFVYEKNKNEKFHIHAIVAIRNFIDYNYTLKNNLKELLLKSLRVVGFISNFRNTYKNDFRGYDHPTNEYDDG